MQVFSGHLDSCNIGGFSRKGKSVVDLVREMGRHTIEGPNFSGQSKYHFKGDMFHQEPINCMDCHPSEPLSRDLKIKVVILSHLKTGKTLMKVEMHTEP